MSKAICEPIKLIVDSHKQIQSLIEALINNYDIYVKEFKVEDATVFDITRYEVKLYEREKR